MRGGFGHAISSREDTKFSLRNLNRRALDIVFASLKGQGLALTIAMLLTLFLTAISVLTPLLIKEALDTHIIPQQWAGLTWVVALFFGLVLLEWMAAYRQTYLTRVVAYKAITNIRTRLYKHVIALDFCFHTDNKVGATTSVIMNDVESILNLVSQGFIFFINDLLTIIAITVALFVLNTQLAALLLVTTPIIIISTNQVGKRLRQAQRKAQENLATLTAGVSENLAGVREVKTFSQEQRQTQRLQILSQETARANVKAVTISALLFPVMDLTSAIGVALVVWRGGSWPCKVPYLWVF